MKSKLTILTLCLLIGSIGCQSPQWNLSAMKTPFFGSKKTDHTLAQQLSTAKTTPASHQPGGPSEFAQGENALQSGNLRDAKNHFQKVVQDNPNSAAAHHRLAYIADKSGNYSIAEIHYMAAMRIEPRNPDIVCDLGYSYLMQDRYEDSRRQFEKALMINPNHQASLLNYATLLGKQNDYSGALAMFRMAGSEQEAQQNIARLFPQGPPAGYQIDSNSINDLSPATRELQRKLARSRQQLENPGGLPQGQRPRDPREIPPEMINDYFAQIDREFENSRLNAPSIHPGYEGSITESDPRMMMVGQQRPRQQPTELPAQPVNNPPEPASGPPPQNPLSDYAIIGNDHQVPQQQQPHPQMAQQQQESPYFQAPPAGQQLQMLPPELAQHLNPNANLPNHPGQPQNQANPVPPNQTIPPSYTVTAQQTPPSQASPKYQHPFAHLPTEAEKVAAMNGTPSTLPPQLSPGMGQSAPLNNPQQNVGDYQMAAQKALQLGLNAGPGQMFPVARNSAAPAPAPTVNPPGYQTPNGNLPPSVSLNQNLNLPALSDPAANLLPGNATGQPLPNWPYAPTQNMTNPLAQNPLPATTQNIQTVGGQTPPAQNNPVINPAPWMQNSASPASGQNQLPQTTPQSNYTQPQPWPHAPNSQDNNSSYSPPVIHRGSQPVTQPAPSLPQIMPNNR